MSHPDQNGHGPRESLGYVLFFFWFLVLACSGIMSHVSLQSNRNNGALHAAQ